LNCISPLRWSIGILAPCLLSHPLFAEDFFLDFDGPRLLTGARGSKVRGSFTCLLGNYQSGVAEGWAFGVVVDGGKIVSITLEGTAAEHARSFGFERTELTSGPGNEGAISKVVYSLTEPTSLGLYPPQVIAFLEVESDVSPGIHYATLRYHDGLRGSVELVENFVRSAGGRYVPTLTDRSIVISDEPPCGDLLLGFSGDNVDSPLPFEGVIGGVGTSGEVVFPTPQGEKGRVHLYADIVPLLPAGNDCSGGRIVEGWVLSVELTGEAEPAAVSVRGTSVDMYFWNGFERTLIAEAADNGGRKGPSRLGL